MPTDVKEKMYWSSFTKPFSLTMFQEEEHQWTNLHLGTLTGCHSGPCIKKWDECL